MYLRGEGGFRYKGVMSVAVGRGILGVLGREGGRGEGEGVKSSGLPRA